MFFMTVLTVEVSLLQVSDVSHVNIYRSFHAGIYDYHVIGLGRSRDGAINWCAANLDAVLPLPDTESEWEVSYNCSGCYATST